MAGHLAIIKDEKIKNSLFLNGSYADCFYGSYKSFAFNGSKRNKIIFDAERKKALNKNNVDSTDYLEKLMFKESGCVVKYPFYDRNIFDYFMGLSYKELGGATKKIFFAAFGDRLPKKHKVRRRSQQIDSGIRGLGLY